MMDLAPLNSTMLTHIGHDPIANRLTVIFKNGGTYHYAGVSADEHKALLSAGSIGRHFQQHIRSKKAATHG
jgi:hypothetical protein